jgi:hypothetical protein
MRLAGVTSIRMRRASILLHDDSCPIWMHTLGILNKKTLATATNAPIVGIAATTAVIVTHEL